MLTSKGIETIFSSGLGKVATTFVGEGAEEVA